MIQPSVDGRFVLVTDLGIDQVLVYRLNTGTGQLVLNEQGTAAVSEHPGAGPRHFAFAASGRHAYVINELNSTVTVYDYAPERGEIHARQVVSTLPEGIDGPAIGKLMRPYRRLTRQPICLRLESRARQHRHLGGRRDERHTAVSRALVDAGNTPRNFSLDPTGTWLLVANQESNTIVPFRRDPGSAASPPRDR